MPKQLRIFPEKCIGCKSCEVACSFANEGAMNPSKSRISMIAFIAARYKLPYNAVFTCRQCADAPCLGSCPVDAISRSKDKMKVVLVDREACIGCGECVGTCPFGAMLFNRKTKEPFKCELCGGKPACVSICPTEAIVFVDKRSFYSKAQALQMEGFLMFLNRNRQNVRESKKDD
jgi:carbon-monoxide dehydrogenase iron sulfur subunit